MTKLLLSYLVVLSVSGEEKIVSGELLTLPSTGSCTEQNVDVEAEDTIKQVHKLLTMDFQNTDVKIVRYEYSGVCR